jgi:hypothetical protein
MTTTDTQTPGAGDIESVAMSLLVTEEDKTEAVDTGDADPAEAEVDEAVEADDDDVETADEDAGAEEPKESRIRVKVDGEEVEVTLSDLKRAYAGQGYIQKRMEDVASLRKEAETVYRALNDDRAQLAQVLSVYQQQLAAAGQPQKPTKELLDRDPISYFEQMEAYREAVEQQQTLQAQQTALVQQQQALQRRVLQAYLAEQAHILAQRIPDFADAKKAGDLKRELVKVGAEYGYSADELGAVRDARAVQVLHDAMRYRQLMAGKQKVAEKVAQARPVVRPGVARPETDGRKVKAEKLRSRMRSTGSVEDVAAYLLAKG